MNNGLRLMTAGLLALFVGVITGCSEPAPEYKGKDLSGIMPPLAFNLTSEGGQEVTAADWAGQTRLLFFGFVSCPDICPTTLSRLSRALEKLPEEQRKQTTVLFVSVDPQRDTPEDLKAYTNSYGASFVGLTAREPALRDLAKRYRTTFSYGEKNEQGHYDVSHSNAIFVFDGQGESRLLLRGSMDPEAIAHDLSTLASS
jgi:protein SCO1/2